MSGFTAIDLSQLPPPRAVEALDHADIVAELTAALIAEAPELALVLGLPSEPLTKFVRIMAYREMVWRNRLNLAVQSSMLAFATGSDLDQRAVDRWTVRRPGESDEALRARAALAPEGYSVAGPLGAYDFHARSASADVADVFVDSPTPGQVRVSVLSAAETGDGAGGAALIPVVQAALSDETIRPFTDQVTVEAAVLLPYSVTIVLTVRSGPDAEPVRVLAAAAAAAYAAERRRLGRDVRRSGFVAAAFQPGVVDAAVTLTRAGAPVEAVAIGDREAAILTALSVTIGGVDV